MELLSFTISNSDYLIPLGVACWINNDKIIDVEAVTEEIKINKEISIATTDCELKIILKNKLPEHTRINEAGEIIQDAVLALRDVAVNGINLDRLVSEYAEYSHDFNGSQALATHKFFGTLGCNGILSFKFQLPLHLWLLEHM